MDQDTTWYRSRPWPRRHCVRWGPSSALPKRGQTGRAPPQFLAHVYCRQTAGWIKVALGMEVGLGPGHIVLDGFPAIGKRGTAAPLFSAHTYCGHGRPSQLLLSSCLCLFCVVVHLLQCAQCSHCKRCTSYSNSVCPSIRPSVCLSVRHTPVLLSLIHI